MILHEVLHQPLHIERTLLLQDSKAGLVSNIIWNVILELNLFNKDATYTSWMRLNDAYDCCWGNGGEMEDNGRRELPL